MIWWKIFFFIMSTYFFFLNSIFSSNMTRLVPYICACKFQSSFFFLSRKANDNKMIWIIVCYSVIVKGDRHVHAHQYQVDWHANTLLCQLMDLSVLSVDLAQCWFVHRLTCICWMNLIKNYFIAMVFFSHSIFLFKHLIQVH